MTPEPVDLDALPLAAVERIDHACLEFERAWRAGGRPPLGPYLAAVPAAGRTALLRQLLLVEFEYRPGDPPRLDEFVAAYPDLAESLRRAFPGAAPAPPPGAAMPRRVGSYRVVRELGRGGMGVVYEAVQEPLGRLVALKVLAARAGAEGEVARFRREAAVAARLHHTNIVPVFEAGQDGEVLFYAMQLIRGRDLHRFVAEVRRVRGRPATDASPGRYAAPGTPTAVVRVPSPDPTPLPEPADLPWPAAELAGPGYFRRVAEVAAQAADALAHAHAHGAVHRDVKPTNLLLDGRGTVWVTDFGLVQTDDPGVTASGLLAGTLRYLPPERLKGASDARGDVYSLGLTLYELAVLRPAFGETDFHRLIRAVGQDDPLPPRAVDPRVPRDLETVILKAADKSPARRYATAADLAADLRRFLRGEPVNARRAGPVVRARLWARRHPYRAGGLVALAAALGLVVAAALWTADTAVRNEAATRTLLDEVKAERDEKARALVRADGLRLVAQSEATRAADPGLALLLAVAGAERVPGLLANNALQDALDACRERRVLAGHRGAVLTAGFGDGGRKVVTGGADGTARVWDADTGRQLLVVEHPDLVRAVLSPDGRRLVTLSGSEVFRRTWLAATNHGVLGWEATGPAVRLWDAATGREVARWQPARPPGEYWMAFAAGAAFSPDGRRVVSFFGTHPGGHPLVHDAETGELVATLTGATPVLAVAFGPDDRTVAVAAADDRVRLYDAGTGRLLHTLAGHTSAVLRMAFSPDGRRLLTIGTGRAMRLPPETPFGLSDAADDAAGRVWDVATGRPVTALAWPAADRTPFEAGAVSPDGRLAVLVNGRSGFQLWDAATGRHLPGRPGLNPGCCPAYATAVGADGATAVFVGNDRTPKVLAGMALVPLAGHTDVVNDAAFSPAGDRVVTASADGTARLWAAPDQNFPEVAGADTWAGPAAVGPDGRRLVARRTRPPASELIDAETGRVLARFESGVEGHFPAGGGVVVATPGGGPGNPCRVGRVDDAGQPLGPAAEVPGRVLAVDPAGRRAALTRPLPTPGGRPQVAVRVWDLVDAKKVAELRGEFGPADRAAFAPDARWLLTHSPDLDRPARVWDAATGAAVPGRPPAPPSDWWAAVAPSGREAYYFRPEGTSFRAVDPGSGREVRAYTQGPLLPAAGPGAVSGLDFAGPRVRLVGLSPDGRRLLAPGVATGRTHLAGVWDAAVGGDPVAVLSGHSAEITLSRFVDGGRKVVTGSADRTARLWEAETGRELAVFRGHEAGVTAGDLSPAGDRLVTAAADGTVRVWELDGGREAARLRWPGGPVEQVRFTPDGRRVVVRSAGAVRLWDLNILGAARARLPRPLTAAERERYQLPGS